MRKFKLYLDTSVLNFYYADDSPNEKKITQELFREIKSGTYTAFISSTVLEEISKASEQKQKSLLSLIEEYNLTPLEIDEEIENLATLYIKNRIIPQKYEEDAIHNCCVSCK